MTQLVEGRVLLHEQGPALWPEYVPMAELSRKHAELGTPLYQTLFQSDEGGLKGEIIWRELFRYGYAPGTHPDVLGRSICRMTVDPAISKSTKADSTAIAIGNVSLDVPRRLFVRFVWAGRVSSMETATKIAEIAAYYHPEEIGIEANAYQSSLLEIVQSQYPSLPLTPIYRERDKLSRQLALGALYELGLVVHHPMMQGDAMELELTKLPGGRHDDMADAIADLADLGGLTGADAVASSVKPAGFR
jgi:phage terminase large subunit-like protein